MPESGYTNCACRDCFDIAVSNDTDHPERCWECDESGCDETGESECTRVDAYGCGDDAFTF